MTALLQPWAMKMATLVQSAVTEGSDFVARPDVEEALCCALESLRGGARATLPRSQAALLELFKARECFGVYLLTRLFLPRPTSTSDLACYATRKGNTSFLIVSSLPPICSEPSSPQAKSGNQPRFPSVPASVFDSVSFSWWCWSRFGHIS